MVQHTMLAATLYDSFIFRTIFVVCLIKIVSYTNSFPFQTKLSLLDLATK